MRVCTRRRLIAAALLLGSLLVVFVVTALCLLAFGNPQWCSEVYIFQSQVFPGEEPSIPQDFSGTWQTWWGYGSLLAGPYGTLKEEIEVRHGVRHGRYRYWSDTGELCASGFFKNGKKHGKWIRWSDSGQREREFWCKHGVEHGPVKEWDYDGNLIRSGYKRDGFWEDQLAQPGGPE